MSADNETLHESVGLPDGHVDHNDEKIVYEYDDSGNLAGWHKEPTKEKSRNQIEVEELAAQEKEVKE